MLNATRKTWIVGALAVLGSIAGWRVYTDVSLRTVPAASGIVPYTVLSKYDLYDQAGLLKSTSYYVEAQRSDGSRMRRATDQRLQQRDIYLADGARIITDDLNAKKITYTKAQPEPLRDPQASCLSPQLRDAGFKLSGVEMVDGHRAARIEGKLGKNAITAWYALDAGCAELQSSFGHKLDALIVGEPDPALFQLSAALKEMPPSEFYTHCVDGVPCMSNPEPSFVKADQKYHAARGE